MSKQNIPKPLAIIVGDEIGGFYYNHRRINLLFYNSGAPGDPPEGNCCEKVTEWLIRSSTDPKVDVYSVLGKVLEEYMEVDQTYGDLQRQQKGRRRIREALERYGLSYQQGGKILRAGFGSQSHSLREILLKRNYSEIAREFDRAIENVESDPDDTITASCAILESLCKIYIEDEGLTLPAKQTINRLWQIVQKHLGLDPASLEDKDLARILTGLASIVDGIGALRTHTGDAHGRGRRSYKPQPRHARLAASAAHTLTFFLLETWDQRSSSG
jgi:hypothetical protein